jgi:SSS family solute:Na+ symporter
MNFSLTDWIVFAALFIALNSMAFFCRKYVRGVSDFLVAGRGVGRFLGLGSDSMAGLGAITILAMWQMNYKSGFVGQWWYLLTPVASAVIALTGFGIYRFRQTRAMTLGQFIEMRYSKKTRILFGSLAYFAGVLNMGIFPAVGAGFFVYYCGFPATFTLGAVTIPTVIPVMLILVASSVAICFWGGQITLILTDFIQSIFIDIMLVVIMIFIYRMFTWDQFSQAYLSVDNAEALLHPFKTAGTSEFDQAFFMISVFFMFYWIVSWAPNAMLSGSARDAHEAKMMKFIAEIKKLAYLGLGIGVLPLAVFVMMHHADFAAQAEHINQAVAGLENDQIRSQMLVPAGLMYILPKGLLGAFAGVVLFAFISTHDTYLLAWGGILIQDVVIPLRGKPLEPKRHMKWLRASVLLVAVFIILFSIFFNQVDNIYMFLAISGALYMTSAGVVLLAGLYWKRGTTEAAWTTMIVGLVLSVAGFCYRIINPDFMNGTTMCFAITLICILTYFIVSLVTPEPDVNLDEILNRRKEDENVPREKSKILPFVKWRPEVPQSDRVLIPVVYTVIGAFLIVFVGTCIYNMVNDVPVTKWLSFWHVYLYLMFTLGSAFLVWIIVGGLRDIAKLFRSLKERGISDEDDGSVVGRHASG